MQIYVNSEHAFEANTALRVGLVWYCRRFTQKVTGKGSGDQAHSCHTGTVVCQSYGTGQLPVSFHPTTQVQWFVHHMVQDSFL